MATPSVEPPHNIQQNRTTPQLDDSLYELRDDIFKTAMSCKWGKVCDLFLKNKQVHCQPITHNNDSVLHVAISGAPENIVLKLLKTIETNNSEGIYYSS
jgi:hypothetical protein